MRVKGFVALLRLYYSNHFGFHDLLLFNVFEFAHILDREL